MITIEKFSSRRDLVSKIEKTRGKNDKDPVCVLLPAKQGKLYIYPQSLKLNKKGGYFVAGLFNKRKALFILGDAPLKVMQEYEGRFILHHSDFSIKKCRWSRSVARQLRVDFPQYAPAISREEPASISFGDALGLAGRAQLQIFNEKASLAFSRQCVHKMRQLGVYPEDTLDNVTQTVFQEGYEKKYAAEACNLTTEEDIEEMLAAGYNRLSIEPAGKSMFSARDLTKKELLEEALHLPWIDLRDKFELLFHRYQGKRIEILTDTTEETEEEATPLEIMPSESQVLSAMNLFSRVLLHVVEMERILSTHVANDQVLLELSFMQTGEELTPFEHYFLINELSRHNVYPDFLAPGSLSEEHFLIAKHFGQYGLTGTADSLESGDGESWLDVFLRLSERWQSHGIHLHLVYPDISYITALECIAVEQPELFGEIWDISRKRFIKAEASGYSDLKIQHIPTIDMMSDEDLKKLVHQEYSQEFLELTMPFVLNEKDHHGNRYYRKKIFDFLNDNESVYTEALMKRYLLD